MFFTFDCQNVKTFFDHHQTRFLVKFLYQNLSHLCVISTTPLYHEFLQWYASYFKMKIPVMRATRSSRSFESVNALTLYIQIINLTRAPALILSKRTWFLFSANNKMAIFAVRQRYRFSLQYILKALVLFSCYYPMKANTICTMIWWVTAAGFTSVSYSDRAISFETLWYERVDLRLNS